jgi:hypothetical protein
MFPQQQLERVFCAACADGRSNPVPGEPGPPGWGVSNETVKYGREFCWTSTQEWLLWQGPEAVVQ